MRWLKGIAIDRRYGSVQIELETGRKVWTTPDFHLEIQEHVLVSWDYTEDNIGVLTTQERLDNLETEQERAETRMSEDFQSPLDEMVEGDVSDLAEPSTSGKPTDDESVVSEERSFPNPLNDDVDRDDIVLLRDDIDIT